MPLSISICPRLPGSPSGWWRRLPPLAVRPTWSLRRWDSASPTLNRWQRRRLQHQEYERRLLAMRNGRQRQLASATTLAEQQRLTKEVEAYAWPAVAMRWKY